MSQFVLMPGIFAVFYPDDAHMPCCFVDKPEQVRKIVIKVRV
jgi:YhcH/YjgK/YiaL family protein